MPTAYFDCFAGAAGDMITAALLDAGADLDALAAGLARLDLPGASVRIETAEKCHLTGTRFIVDVPQGDQPHRHLGPILEKIAAAGLPARAAERATEVFRRLARAESQVHGVAIEEVHFHEVGAVDSIFDIVGACLALEQLDVSRIVSSPLPLGSGTVKCDHGVLPVPAPATARLVEGFPVTPGLAAGELTTPTAAALLTALADTFGPIPEMRVSSIGYGAGTRDLDGVPNLLRVFIGQECPDGDVDTVVELQTNIDDTTGEVLGAAVETLLAAGALDAWLAPITMKQSRPAWTLHVLARPGDVATVESRLFAETTAFGLRKQTLSRARLRRMHETVETPFGPIRMKLGFRGDRLMTASVELADARKAAESHGAALRCVMDAARKAWETR